MAALPPLPRVPSAPPRRQKVEAQPPRSRSYDVKPTASGTNRAPAPGARPSRTPREATPKLHPHPAFRASQGEERARALAPAPEAGPILQLEILGVTAQDAMSLYNIQLSGCHQPGLAWGEPEKTSSRSSRGDAMF
ncbi:unnamed protein product [Effrenium voratum]|uniref:Uncharacterized protein n=1 Tax=Effrenium voratum TaxID=2562239 RepID=A0AA36HTG3_9DINO|nr:unnamed protein product [Effrenium voratum]